MNRKIVYKFLLLICFAFTGCHSKPNELIFESGIPDSVISAIAKQSFVEQGKEPTIEEIKDRARQVISFIESQGGSVWYKNYRKEFSLPTTGEEYVAEERDVSATQLGYYYIRRNLTGGSNLVRLQCLPNGAKPSPTMDGFCGLANWNAFLVTKDKQYHEEFIKWADLFVSTQQNGKWEWSFDLPSRNLKTPWVSGLTQSVGISLMLRAYQSTHNKNYLDAASKALEWLKLPISKGGVAIPTAHGTWLEEYPDAEQPSHVLNGHMWALFGIWDYFRVTDDPVAKKMFDDGIRIIKADIDKYDVGFWVVYAQTNRVDNLKGNYMAFVIQQLKVLYAITGDHFFDTYSRKWESYQNQDALFIHIATDEFLKSSMTTIK